MGNLPVHEAPPIKVLVSGFFGTFPSAASVAVGLLVAGFDSDFVHLEVDLPARLVDGRSSRA